MAYKLLNAVLWIGWWIAIAIVGSAFLWLVSRALDSSFASTVLGLLSLLVAVLLVWFIIGAFLGARDRGKR